jgi:membrane protein YqaA with SNARE-associated domain
MLKRAYDWVVSYASHPRAVWVLFAVTFLESSISPIPPIPLLIPMCLAKPHKAWFYALVCTAGAVTGGYAGYAIGSLLYDTVGQWIIGFYGLTEKAQALVQGSQGYWFWVLLTKGVTPIPFKIVTIMSGSGALLLRREHPAFHRKAFANGHIRPACHHHWWVFRAAIGALDQPTGCLQGVLTVTTTLPRFRPVSTRACAFGRLSNG